MGCRAIYCSAAVEERCTQAEAVAVRRRGQCTSENVGISNIYRGENPLRRISKGSRATIVVPGLVDPKSGPQEVHPMENTVDIP
jgi:hypothetical protein